MTVSASKFRRVRGNDGSGDSVECDGVAEAFELSDKSPGVGFLRFDLMSLIVLRAALSTTAGAVLGIVAVQAFGMATDTISPLGHTAASATLVVVAALLATVPAGMVAAHRDPVAVLRTA